MLNSPTSYDPYDLWMTPLGVFVREKFYQGRLFGKLLAILVAVADWWMPSLSRKILGSKKRVYPITLAQWIMMQSDISSDQCDSLLDELVSCAATTESGCISWGLGFPWMSKNGLYGPKIPFITHTPYVMEALIHLAELTGPTINCRAITLFDKTLPFLESLLTMHSSEGKLALSYAPIDEPRIVVNANSYAALSYALHSRRQDQLGNHERALLLKETCVKIVNWIVDQQKVDGSWDYYADNEAGNFIDCFHSCFVLKNLRKVSKLFPDTRVISDKAITKGVCYLKTAFYVMEKGLVKRFTERDIKDPFVWDIYDQAEYLGILIDEGEIEQAYELANNVDSHFRKKGSYFCKIDFFGRLWGREFLRWGIISFLYQRDRLNQIEDRVGR